MGPVIGSLFIAGVLIEESKVKKLEEIKVKDSKLLTHKKRIELSKKIKKIAKDFIVLEVPPAEIDEAVDGNNALNLNWLEAKHIAVIINKLNPDIAIIDCPSPNIEKFKGFLKKLLKNKDVELILEHKADVNFLECSSASVLAKVAREEDVERIEKITGESIGSGYPSNPVCKKFLKDNYNKYPDIFRKSWMPYKKHINSIKQKNLADF